jgi:hypothetical protein
LIASNEVNVMVSGFHAGVIAGVIAGLGGATAHVLNSLGLFGWLALPGLLEFETLINHITVEIGISAVFGAIFGIVYSKFYDRIPSKGIKKGLLFGLLTYLMSNIFIVSYLGSYGNFWAAGNYLWAGFFALIPYGLVLGALYKR